MYCYEENKFVLFFICRSAGFLYKYLWRLWNAKEWNRRYEFPYGRRWCLWCTGVWIWYNRGLFRENSTRLQVIDVKALIRDNGDRFYNPFIGTIDQKIVAGEDAQSFLQNVITDSNFKGSVAAMDIKKMLKDSFLALFPLDLSLPLNIHILLNILLLKQKWQRNKENIL